MLFLKEEDVRRRLPMGMAIQLMREVFAALAAGEAQNQPRRRLSLATGAVLHSMGGAWGGYFGTKIYSTHPRHGAHFLFVLYAAETGRPLALFEANYLGQIRTGAVSGLATDLLARAEARVLGIIGSGFQARSQLEAILEVRKIEKVRVWSREAENRQRFAAECTQSFGVEVEAATSAGGAAKDPDIVVTATNAREPVLESEWVGEGTHINAIGSNQPGRRELAAVLVRRADVIAVDSIEQARIESGDLLLSLEPEEWEERLVGLEAVVAGRSGRRAAGQLTIFKSNGLGVEDVAVAGFVYEQAWAAG